MVLALTVDREARIAMSHIYISWINARWLNKSPNLGNVSHKHGEVTPKQWADTRTVSDRSSLKMIFAAIMTYMCELSNTIPQYMYSSNIIDMPHVFSPRFVTQIFVAGKKLLLRSILCDFIRLYEFTTDFLLWIARPLWFLVVSYHDMTVILMYNEIQSQRGQQSILVFLWRITSENVNA